MKTSYRQRFALTGVPFPKNAREKTFFADHDGYRFLERSFHMLLEEPGLGLLTAEPGVGKTASIRNLAGRAATFHVAKALCTATRTPANDARLSCPGTGEVGKLATAICFTHEASSWGSWTGICIGSWRISFTDGDKPRGVDLCTTTKYDPLVTG